MPVLIGNREDLIIHRSGHVVAFEAGKEVNVPNDKSLIRECVQRGHQLKKEAAPAPESAPEKAVEPTPRQAPSTRK